MADRTYSDVVRDAAKLYDIAASHILVADDPSDKDAAELANAVLGSLHREQAARLRSLADLLGVNCDPTTWESLEDGLDVCRELNSPLSDS